MSPTPTPYTSDDPPAEPGFDFDLIGAALAGVFERPAEGATVIGIHGPWGSGKTTLMYAVRKALTEQAERPEPIVVEFNAWKFQEREALWRALILRLIGELRKHGGSKEKLEELETSLYRAFEVQETGPLAINWRAMAIEVASVVFEALQIGVVGRVLRRVFGHGKSKGAEDGVINETDLEEISTAFERETITRHLTHVKSIEQFLGAFQRLVGEITEGGRQIVVLVDDLDRCLPEAALEVFEAIKLFLDAPQCGFVVAVDREVIRNGLAVRYAPLQGSATVTVADADEYIEKTIAISYDVPRLSASDVTSLIDDGLPLELGPEAKRLITLGLGANPRRVKRFLNLLRLQIDLAARAAEKGHEVPPPLSGEGDAGDLALLIKVMLIGYRYPFLLRGGGDLSLLLELQQGVLTIGAKKNPEHRKEQRRALFEEMPPPVARLVDSLELWNLLRLGPQLHLADNKVLAAAYLNWFRRTGVDVRSGEAGAPEEPR